MPRLFDILRPSESTVNPWVTTRWYGALLENQQIMDAAVLSLQIAGISATAATVLGTLAGLALNRSAIQRKKSRPIENFDQTRRQVAAGLPFSLTPAQERVLDELASDLVREHTFRLHDYIRRSWKFLLGPAEASNH